MSKTKEMPGATAATAATAAIRPSKPKRGQRSNRGIWLGLLSIALVLLIWWLVAIALNNESLLPYPSSVWNEFIKDLGNGSLLANSWASLQRVLIGFVIAVISSIPVGFLLGWYSIIRGIAEPVIQFLRVIPPIAIIPLIIVYLGIGEPAKIFLIWYSAFLTIVITVYGGIRAIDSTLIRAGRVLGAKDLDIFLDIAVPASVPFIFVGMRLGLAAAWSTLVAAELIASSSGLGYLITQAGQYRNLSAVLLGIGAIGVIGLVMDRGILLLDNKLTNWQEREVR